MKDPILKATLRTKNDCESLWGVLKTWKGQQELGAPLDVEVGIYKHSRSREQNRMMWKILTAFSEQVQWPINGVLQSISKEDWKAILSASFKSEMARLTQTTDGRVVMLGVSTSAIPKREFSEFIEFLLAVAADRGVVFEREDFSLSDLRSAVLKHIVGREVTVSQMAFLLGKGNQDVADEMENLHREGLLEAKWDDKGFWIYEALKDPTA